MPRQPLAFISESLPGVDLSAITGKLIALEGAVSSEVIQQLRNWLMLEGFAVCIAEHHSNASQFARDLEREWIPALRAGFIVLANGYAYSLIAEGVANGLDRKWLEKVMGFALAPNLVCYLRSTATPKRRADALQELAEKNGFLVIDADRPDVLAQIKQAISGAIEEPQASETRDAQRRPSARRTRKG